MREVSIEGLAEREIVGVICECRVDGRVTGSDVLVGEASYKLLKIADALRAAGGITERVLKS